MAPDLNSLPPSHSPEMAPRHSSSNPADSNAPQRSPSVSLAQAATINAGIQHQESRRSSTSSSRRGSPQVPRRRSNVAMSLNLSDPTIPGPGEMQSPDRRLSMTQQLRTSSPHSLSRSPTIPSQRDPQQHHRAPSLGELHQELEQEQEAQVNRLLQMIRQQQIQLHQLQTERGHSAAVEDTPTSETSTSVLPGTNPIAIPYAALPRARSPGSRPYSGGNSPSLRPTSASFHRQQEELALSTSTTTSRDESAYYQAETQTLTRENQMLRQRVRELERQLSEVHHSSPNAPATPSNLTAPPLSIGDAQVPARSIAEQAIPTNGSEIHSTP